MTVISRLIEKGVIVELEEGVDAFVPTSQLSPGKIKNVTNHFQVDQELNLKVIDFDKENKKIVLSTVAYLKDKSDEEIAEYMTNHKLEKVNVSNFKNAETSKVESVDFPTFEVSPAAGKPKKDGN